jgi:type I restriction enzyme, S subunit
MKTLDQISTNLDSRRVPITKGVRVGGDYPYYGASGIVDYVADYIFNEDTLLISEDGANLLARSTPVAFPASGKYWVNNHAHVLRFDNQTTQRFVELFLESIPLDKYITGAAQPKLNQAALNSIPIPIPLPPEQRRIVSLLDGALEGIATVKANAEQNLQNARALFDSYLQSVLTERGPGWVEGKLGDVCGIARGGSPRPIQKFITTASDGINWIKIGDATASGKYIYTTEEKIIPEGAKRSRIVHDGDFLLSNSMSFGRPYIMRTTGCIHDGWLVLTDYAARLDQDYLYHVLGSRLVFQQFDQLAAGSTVRNLNIGLASRVDIPIPPLRQQRSIAERFDACSAETERLAAVYERKLSALGALKKSLLHDAFTGHL